MATGGGGLFFKKYLYVDVPAGHQNFDFRFTYSVLAPIPTISISISYKNTQVCSTWVLFMIIKIHPIYVNWASLSVMKPPPGSLKQHPKRKAHICIPSQCENPSPGMATTFSSKATQKKPCNHIRKQKLKNIGSAFEDETRITVRGLNITNFQEKWATF